MSFIGGFIFNLCNRYGGSDKQVCKISRIAYKHNDTANPSKASFLVANKNKEENRGYNGNDCVDDKVLLKCNRIRRNNCGKSDN